jgi:DNA-binding CsgD family transcriptional regulator
VTSTASTGRYWRSWVERERPASSRGATVRAGPRPLVARIGPLLRPRPRVVEILDLAALGLSDKEIARRLGLAHRTVRSHLERLYADTGAAGRTEAVAAWAWLGALRLAVRLPTGDGR